MAARTDDQYYLHVLLDLDRILCPMATRKNCCMTMYGFIQLLVSDHALSLSCSAWYSSVALELWRDGMRVLCPAVSGGGGGVTSVSFTLQ